MNSEQRASVAPEAGLPIRKEEYNVELKHLPKLSLPILLLCAILVVAVSPVAANEGDGDKPQPRSDYVGSVSSMMRSGPLPRTARGPTTSSTNQTPGGGYAYANSMLAWAPFRMDGTAETGLVGTTLVFILNARVVQVYKSGTPKGGAGPNWGFGSGGAQVSATKNVFEWVFGSQWRLDTSHRVDGNGFLWTPTNTIYATP